MCIFTHALGHFSHRLRIWFFSITSGSTWIHKGSSWLPWEKIFLLHCLELFSLFFFSGSHSFTRKPLGLVFDSSFTSIKRLFSSSLPSAIRMVSSTYLRLLIFLPAILIPACASSSPAFLMMYFAYKLNKQGDNIQPWRTPFSYLEPVCCSMSSSHVASWPAYRFLRRQVRWSDIPISFRIFHSLLWWFHVNAVFFCLKTWSVVKPGAWLASSPPGAQQFQECSTILSMVL